MVICSPTFSGDTAECSWRPWTRCVILWVHSLSIHLYPFVSVAWLQGLHGRADEALVLKEVESAGQKVDITTSLWRRWQWHCWWCSQVMSGSGGLLVNTSEHSCGCGFRLNAGSSVFTTLRLVGKHALNHKGWPDDQSARRSDHFSRVSHTSRPKRFDKWTNYRLDMSGPSGAAAPEQAAKSNEALECPWIKFSWGRRIIYIIICMHAYVYINV